MPVSHLEFFPLHTFQKYMKNSLVKTFHQTNGFLVTILFHLQNVGPILHCERYEDDRFHGLVIKDSLGGLSDSVRD